MVQLNLYLTTSRYGIRDTSYEKHRVQTTGCEMLSTQIGRSVLLRGWNLTQHFPRAHEAHSLETWESWLRTMKIQHGGHHVGFIWCLLPSTKTAFMLLLHPPRTWNLEKRTLIHLETKLQYLHSVNGSVILKIDKNGQPSPLAKKGHSHKVMWLVVMS